MVSGRCGELVAFGMLCRGARRDAVAILNSGSCGDGGINTAAAIHKDIQLRAEVVAVEDWTGLSREGEGEGEGEGGEGWTRRERVLRPSKLLTVEHNWMAG